VGGVARCALVHLAIVRGPSRCLVGRKQFDAIRKCTYDIPLQIELADTIEYDFKLHVDVWFYLDKHYEIPTAKASHSRPHPQH